MTMNANTKHEDRHERFKRLATQRTNNVLRAIRILGNCSNKSVYGYGPEEVNKIFTEIERKIRETKTRFHIKRSDKFKL